MPCMEISITRMKAKCKKCEKTKALIRKNLKALLIADSIYGDFNKDARNTARIHLKEVLKSI